MSQIPLPLTPLNTSFYKKNGIVNNEGEQINSPVREEISTLFVVGFPEDMQEREFQNMFVFSSGFEAATLKIPLTKEEKEEVPKKQSIGFVKFRTRKEANEAKDVLNGRRIDLDKGSVLKAEMAKKNLHTKKVNNIDTDMMEPEDKLLRFNTPYEAFYSVPPSSIPKELLSPTSISEFDFYNPPPENLRSQSVDTRSSLDLFTRQRPHSRLSAAANRFHKELDYLSNSDRNFVNPLSPPLRPTTSTGLMHDTTLSRMHPHFIHTSNSTPPQSISQTPQPPISPPHLPPPPGILSPNHSYRSLGGMLVGSTNPADQNPPCNTLYVGNLPPNTDEEELKILFSACSGYRRLSFKNKSNGPMCFVEFEDAIYAAQALQDLHGNLLSNSVKGGIRLSFSKNPLGVRQGTVSS